MYFVAKLDEEKCTGCRVCIVSCPDPNVIAFVKDKKTVRVDSYRCKGCGLCATACPRDALSIGQQ